jgi:O-succinylbenzoate synthase
MHRIMNTSSLRITRVDLLHLRPRLRRPFETSFVRLEDKDTVLVRAFTDDGLIGYGEAPAMPVPYYNDECTDTVLLMLERFILPSVLGVEIPSIEALQACYAPIKGHHMAKTGIEGAYWHLRAQRENKPLWELWGGVRDRIEAGISIGTEATAEQVVAKVGVALDAGYRRIKVKIAPGRDVAVAQAIRANFPAISLMLDANSAYTLADSEHLSALDQFDLLMLEQPLAHDDIIDHARLQEQLSTPICLDESIHTRDDARKAIDIGATRIINIKPPRVGGFWEAKLLAEDCERRGVPVWCGGMLETGIGKAFNIHISTLRNFSLPGDTSGTDQYFEQDVLSEPIVVGPDSCIAVPATPGLGFEIDEGAIRTLTVASRRFDAD